MPAFLFSAMCLLILAVASSAIVEFLDLPIPPSLIGMSLLFCYLLVNGVSYTMQRLSSLMLSHLGLFFVPVTVSLVLIDNLATEQAIWIAAGLLLSTLISLPLTAVLWVKLRAKQTP